MIKTILQVILTVTIIAAGIFFGKHLMETAPEAKRQAREKPAPLVETITTNPQRYNVQIATRGTVTPRTESTLISQVSGQVLTVNDGFRSGGFFEKGELLLKIDPVDYQLALTSARAEQAKMYLALKEEQAQSTQAASDWEKLGMKGQPDPLVLRKPQLANVRASLASAEARVKRAEIDLQRTEIIAPYAGRVLQKQVDIGQYVTPNTQLAKIYAIDYVEVRLPLTDHQQAMIDLPESYRNEDSPTDGPLVSLSSDLGGKTYNWQGKIVRTEGSIDSSSRQLFVIAQVNDPYAKNTQGRPPLKIGQFVRASITGKSLDNVFVLPRSVLSGTASVLLVDQNNTLLRKKIEILWQDQQNIVSNVGLRPGDQIITTSLPYAVDGSKIRLEGDETSARQKKHQ